MHFSIAIIISLNTELLIMITFLLKCSEVCSFTIFSVIIAKIFSVFMYEIKSYNVTAS